MKIEEKEKWIVCRCKGADILNDTYLGVLAVLCSFDSKDEALSCARDICYKNNDCYVIPAILVTEKS